MVNIILPEDISNEEKISLMHESAKYDIADGDDYAQGCFFRQSSPPKVPKIFLSNNCIFNCAYCNCRLSRECKKRYTNSPDEMAQIAIETAKNNGHGVFITSAIFRNPDYTQELIIETIKKMRKEYGYKGYIHAKIMPGVDPLLIEKAGLLADRISINIELPKSDGYALIAKQKNKNNILGPMSYISERIRETKYDKSKYGGKFAPSGQTTQMMVGTMYETDSVILNLAEALYKKYDLRRVYYSPFSPVQEFEFLPLNPTPKWRAHRLYQADRLIKLYGFKAGEIVPDTHQNLEFDLDPKTSWALKNMDKFPVEVNKADYEMLLRVPGIGIAYALKIIEERKRTVLTEDIIKKIGISVKRAKYFITCNGKYSEIRSLNEDFLREKLRCKPLQISFFNS